jgi:SHS2 domain-containing protein
MESKPFEFVAHTADVAALVRGHDLEDVLRNAAAAFYSLAMGERSIAATLCRSVAITSVDNDALLVDWLNELIYLLFVDHQAFSQFEFDELADGRLRVNCHGQHLLPCQLHLKREVKAATYHMAHLAPDRDGLIARIVFDV